MIGAQRGLWPRKTGQPGKIGQPGRSSGPVTGLLGGSFNPAHAGHRRISLFTMQGLNLDELWWMVSPGNPLKPKKGMAPLSARVGSARAMSRNVPIKVTAIERELGTKYSCDSLASIKRTFPNRRFIWLMGADNLAQFHLWKNWRQIAQAMPIAVIARPGYDDDAIASPAMKWLRCYRTSVSRLRRRQEWRGPALLELRFDPDGRSATRIREKSPDWADGFTGISMRDEVTHALIEGA